MTSSDRPAHVYLNLANFPEYQDFQYKFGFETVLFAVSFVFFIPAIFCITRMIIFYLKNPKITVSSHGIHPYVFKTFLTMQVWNTILTIDDIFIVRLPATTIFTSTCVKLEQDTIFRYIYAGGYFTFVTSQSFTAMFCLTRVVILYSLFNHDVVCEKLFIIWSIITYLLSFVDSIPNVLSTIICMQLDTPFQQGSIALTSAFVYGNNFMNWVHFLFSTGIVIVIIVTTTMVIVKLRRDDSRKSCIRSVHRMRAETILTVTTVLIIIPLLVAQAMTMASLMNSPYFSYILAIRPLMLDLRVNVVSIYFYMTHPLFKKRKVNSGPATMFGSSTI